MLQTNFRKSARAEWVGISQRADINCRIRVLIFDIDRELARHLNCVRHARAVRLGKHDLKIPDVAYHTYAKYYTEPTLEEGYSDIIHVSFVPSFDNEEEETLFKRIY
jgi:bifunctional polynucleotide phosphatase/kinase